MGVARCRNCGSNSIRADRALAGRLICNQCGCPLEGPFSSGKNLSLTSKSIGGRKTYFLVAILIIFFIVVL